MPTKKTTRPPYSARTDRRPVQIWLSAEQREIVEKAAAKDQRAMTQILLIGGLQHAKKILQKSVRN